MGNRGETIFASKKETTGTPGETIEREKRETTWENKGKRSKHASQETSRVLRLSLIHI